MTSNKHYVLQEDNIELRKKNQNLKEESYDNEPVYVNTTSPRGQTFENVDPDYEIIQRISKFIVNSKLAQVTESNDTPNKGKNGTRLVYRLLGLMVLLFLGVVGTAIALGITTSAVKGSIDRITSERSWSEWGSWSQCSVSCGFGKTNRNRTCAGDQYCEGDPTEHQLCFEAACSGVWSQWQPWDHCSTTCDFGLTHRTRTCSEDHTCVGDSTEYKICNEVPCQGVWSKWQPWSHCSVSCGLGSSQRNRTCSEDHSCVGDSTEYTICDEILCQGVWSQWQSWSHCSASCGFGLTHRNRTCSEDHTCVGDHNEYKICNEEPCQGVWSQWQPWSHCSATCGFGLTYRNRNCTEDHICVGDPIEYTICNEVPCQGVGFFVNNPDNINFSTVLKFKNQRYNVNNVLDMSTGQFVCQQAGLYFFIATIGRYYFSSNKTSCHFYKNNVPVESLIFADGYGTSSSVGTNFILLSLQVGEEVHLGRCENVGDFDWYTSFSGFLVSLQ